MDEMDGCNDTPDTAALMKSNGNVVLNVDGNSNGSVEDKDKNNDGGQEEFDPMELLLRKQNLYIQAQTVARAATGRVIGISVYGLVLNRNLFLAFFSPFVAFFLFCLNT